MHQARPTPRPDLLRRSPDPTPAKCLSSAADVLLGGPSPAADQPCYVPGRRPGLFARRVPVRRPRGVCELTGPEARTGRASSRSTTFGGGGTKTGRASSSSTTGGGGGVGLARAADSLLARCCAAVTAATAGAAIGLRAGRRRGSRVRNSMPSASISLRQATIVIATASTVQPANSTDCPPAAQLDESVRLIAAIIATTIALVMPRAVAKATVRSSTPRSSPTSSAAATSPAIRPASTGTV